MCQFTANKYDTMLMLLSVDFLQESRAQINDSLRTRSGMEPRLVLHLDENDAIHAVFVIGDAITLCQTSSIYRGRHSCSVCFIFPAKP